MRAAVVCVPIAHGDEQYEHRESTTWVWERRRIEQRPKGPSSTSSERRPRLSRREAREPVTLTIRYRGGSEAWWEVKGRGRSWRFPGYLAIHDVMKVVLNLDD